MLDVRVVELLWVSAAAVVNICNNTYTTRVSKVHNKLSRVFVEGKPEISFLAFYAEISEFGGKVNQIYS